MDKFKDWFRSYEQKLGARGLTFGLALEHFLRAGGTTIVETGTARIPDNWTGDGMSSLLFNDFVNAFGGNFHTVDLSPENTEFARQQLNDKGNTTLHTDDSVSFLGAWGETPIDLLYLDSMDFITSADPNPPQNHCLKEIQIALPKLSANAAVLIDDCNLPHGGKGRKAIHWLITQGWVVQKYHYQALLTRKGTAL